MPGAFHALPIDFEDDAVGAVIAEWLRYAMALVGLAAILWAVSAFTKGRDDAEATS